MSEDNNDFRMVWRVAMDRDRQYRQILAGVTFAVFAYLAKDFRVQADQLGLTSNTFELIAVVLLGIAAFCSIRQLAARRDALEANVDLLSSGMRLKVLSEKPGAAYVKKDGTTGPVKELIDGAQRSNDLAEERNVAHGKSSNFWSWAHEATLWIGIGSVVISRMIPAAPC